MKSSANHFSLVSESNRISSKGSFNWTPSLGYSSGCGNISQLQSCKKKVSTAKVESTALNSHNPNMNICGLNAQHQRKCEAAQLLSHSEQMKPFYVQRSPAVRDSYSYGSCSCHCTCSYYCLHSGDNQPKPNDHLKTESNSNSSNQSRNMVKVSLRNTDQDGQKQKELSKLATGSSFSPLYNTTNLLRWHCKGKSTGGIQLQLFTCLLFAITIILMFGQSDGKRVSRMSSETNRHIVEFRTSSTANTTRTTLASLPETQIADILAKSTTLSSPPLNHPSQVKENNMANSANRSTLNCRSLEVDKAKRIRRQTLGGQLSINLQLQHSNMNSELQSKDFVAALNGVGFGGADNDDMSSNAARLSPYQNNAIECPSFSENSACPCYKFEDGKFLSIIIDIKLIFLN